MSRLKQPKLFDYFRQNYDLLIVAFVSLLGFLWHFYGSVSAYLEYGTKVTFELEEPKDFLYQYPGITYCFRSVIPVWKLMDRFPDLVDDINSVRNEMSVRNDTIFWSRNESQLFTKAGVMGKQLKVHYENKLKDNTTILDILENWGNDLGMACHVYSLPVIDRQNNLQRMLCNDISKVIETINYRYRCFTHFSQLNSTSENRTISSGHNSSLFTTTVFYSKKDLESYKEDMAHIIIETNTSQPLDPFDDSFNVRVTIHSAKMIPFPGFYLNKRLMGRWGQHYDIFFGRQVSHLLEPPFVTNCHHYSRESAGGIVESYDMCLTDCILGFYRDLCQCLPRFGLIYAKSFLRADDRFCGKNNLCQSMNIRTNCSRSCRPDCLQEQFTTEIVSERPWLDINNASAIKVGRKPVPDNVYRHSPAMSWIQLVCDIGGLGGLWLGFSVMAVTKSLFGVLKTIKSKDGLDVNVA